jgi:hypothetical protein
MASSTFTSTFTSTQAPTLFGRGGYNGPADADNDDDSRSPSAFSAPMNFGRGGYNRGDDDEEEDGRGGYN